MILPCKGRGTMRSMVEGACPITLARRGVALLPVSGRM
jgi:hypothetical protein